MPSASLGRYVRRTKRVSIAVDSFDSFDAVTLTLRNMCPSYFIFTTYLFLEITDSDLYPLNLTIKSIIE